MTQQEWIDVMRPAGDLRKGFEEFLHEYVPPNTFIAEIGSFAGASAEMILNQLNGTGFLLCVDSWDKEYYNGQWNMAEVESCFDRLKSNRNMHKMVGQSVPAAKWLLEHSNIRYDVVYIDADHSYEAVMADITNWSKLLKPGGIVAGHDFAHSWPGVTQAVMEVFQRCKIYPDSTWVASIDEMKPKILVAE